MSEAQRVDPRADDELRAVDGRVPGRRGLATRQRLLDRTREMLATSSYRDLKVIDIAREAGTSPATFYQYFSDVEAAILVLSEEVAAQAAHLTKVVAEGSWKGRNGYQTAVDLVDAFLAFWEEHRPLLRVVELATEEGDPRFERIRVRLLNDVTGALAQVAESAKADGRLPADLDATAAAAVLVSMVTYVAAHPHGFGLWGLDAEALRGALARQVAWGVTGTRPTG
ncbi:MAG: TetR family transcriptional regulator [Acidimicrobiia bacterium]